MKTLGFLLNFIAWCVIISGIVGWLYLYWEDRQDVMYYVTKKPETEVVVKDNYIRLAIIGEKHLECERVPWSEIGYAVIDGYNTESAFKWVDDLTPLSSFPKGKLDIGIAEFGHKNIKDAKFVGFSIKHICHGKPKRSPIYWMSVQ